MDKRDLAALLKALKVIRRLFPISKKIVITFKGPNRRIMRIKPDTNQPPEEMYS